MEPEADRDRYPREGRLERDNEAGRAFEEKRRRELENERRRQSELNRKRQQALVAEQERIRREKIDTNIGSIHGLFGHGRHRDALLAGRDTDATDFGSKTGGKLDAGRDRRSSTGSGQDRMIGTIEGRERLAKEQDARFDSALASQAATGDTTRRGGTAPGASIAGDEAQARERATMMDKAIGGTETTIGKGMGNATMVAKGEERAVSF